MQSILERLQKETLGNVAIEIKPTDRADAFEVCGRGELQMAILIETMRREGYELSVGKPHVIERFRNGLREEPFESLVVEVPTDKFGPVMELVGEW